MTLETVSDTNSCQERSVARVQQLFGAATDMAGAAHRGSRKPPSEAQAPTEVVMAAERPDFHR